MVVLRPTKKAAHKKSTLGWVLLALPKFYDCELACI